MCRQKEKPRRTLNPSIHVKTTVDYVCASMFLASLVFPFIYTTRKRSDLHGFTTVGSLFLLPIHYFSFKISSSEFFPSLSLIFTCVAIMSTLQPISSEASTCVQLKGSVNGVALKYSENLQIWLTSFIL